jgi:hypothetical protein
LNPANYIRLKSPPDGRDLMRSLGIMSLLFLVSLPAVTSRIYATDEIQYFSYLRSVWFDHDVSFENEYRYFYDAGPGRAAGFAETHLERETETGRRINFGTIGSAILWAPFYGVADLWVAATGRYPRDGYSYPYIVAVCFGSAVYGVAALALSMIVAVRVTGVTPARALAAAVCIWVGTPLFFYMYLAPAFAHATSAFGVALFVFTWIHVRREWTVGGLVLLAAAGGLMMMVREQDATYLVGPALDFAWQHARGPRASIVRAGAAAAAAAIAFAIVCLPQALAYMSLNGRLGPSRLVMRKMYWDSPHVLEVLTSPRHGFFFWTPLALVAITGFLVCVARLWRSGKAAGERLQHPRSLGVALAVMLGGQIYLLGAIESWTAAGAFGQRRFVGATVFLVIGMATLFGLTRHTWQRVALGLLAAACIYWNLALMALFGTGLMSRQHLDPAENAYAAFVTLPRMAPDLARRYLFDRRSFYRHP